MRRCSSRSDFQSFQGLATKFKAVLRMSSWLPTGRPALMICSLVEAFPSSELFHARLIRANDVECSTRQCVRAVARPASRFYSSPFNALACDRAILFRASHKSSNMGDSPTPKQLLAGCEAPEQLNKNRLRSSRGGWTYVAVTPDLWQR